MSDGAATEQRLRIGEIALLLGVPKSTVSRLFDSGDLRPIRERGWRKAYSSQVSHIATALNACRPGSIEEFAREWLAAHPEPAPAPVVQAVA